MRVERWDDDLAIRLPVSLVEVLQLKEGDNLEVVIRNSQVYVKCKEATLAERLRLLREFRGKLPTSFRFLRNGRG